MAGRSPFDSRDNPKARRRPKRNWLDTTSPRASGPRIRGERKPAGATCNGQCGRQASSRGAGLVCVSTRDRHTNTRRSDAGREARAFWPGWSACVGDQRISLADASQMVGIEGRNPRLRSSDESMRPAQGLARGCAEPSIGVPASRAMSKTVTGASSVTFATRPSSAPLSARRTGDCHVAVMGDRVGVRGM